MKPRQVFTMVSGMVRVFKNQNKSLLKVIRSVGLLKKTLLLFDNKLIRVISKNAALVKEGLTELVLFKMENSENYWFLLITVVLRSVIMKQMVVIQGSLNQKRSRYTQETN